MSATVVGELTTDRQTIILMGIGSDEALAHATAQLQLLTPLIKPTKPEGALQLPASWSAVVQLAATFGPAWRPGPALTAWIGEQVAARLAPRSELAVAPPPGLVPRSYQIEGARLIGAIGSGLLFDDQGTGKTITTLLGLVERHAAAANGDCPSPLPALVICPNAVVDSWVEHVRRWAPRWRAVAWRGTPARRKRLLGTADVYVTSYGTARMDAGETDERHAPLMALRPAMVVADEVHKIKGQATEQSRAVRRLAAKAAGFVGLSGTPITHHPGDLWPALYCLSPAAVPSRERWVGRYCTTIPGDYAATVLGLNDDREPEFRQTLLGQYRRVSKADVLTELPPKVYSVRLVDIPLAYRAAYDAMEQDMIAELPDGGELSAMTVLAQMTRLSQLASAAADVEVTTEVVEIEGLLVDRPHTAVHLKAPSWKADELLEILAERPGKQVIAAAPSRQLMMLAGQLAAAQGYRVGYIVGQQTARERTAQIEAFQAGQLDLICVTTQAGGVGITLTAASTVVFLQRPWSLVDALQMEDRAHRIGSERHDSIEIIDVVAAKTIESRVRSALVGKADQLSKLVEDPRIVRELLGGEKVRDLRRAGRAEVAA